MELRQPTPDLKIIEPAVLHTNRGVHVHSCIMGNQRTMAGN